MLVLQSLHNYLAQVLSPPSIHTALLVTPEGALVSYASQLDCENDQGSVSSFGTTPTARAIELTVDGLPASVVARPTPLTTTQGDLGRVRSKDEVRKVAGLSAEVWAETRGVEGEEGMVESELGRILVFAVEEPREENSGPAEEPLLLLALNGTTDADWEIMSKKARKLAAFLAPSVNKQRGQMQPVSPVSSANGAPKSRTRSTATSPGRTQR
ncbi:hypothetical protein EV401DRAFT_117216 [Pisolithus croceorrhizus]|nr:hypothetical protein EV401DRAFT_117216 [Pisolithus croceorrhizus]